MREYDIENGHKGASRDGSFIPYIVEELISRSAYQVVFDTRSESFINSIPSALKDRVDWVDSNISWKKSTEYLTPLFEELSIISEGPAYRFYKENPNSDDKNNLGILSNIHGDLAKLFLSIDENLQIDIDILSLKKSLTQARITIRNPEGRARIAVLQGIIESYQNVESPCIIAIPTAPEIIVEHFQRLSCDTHYLELSRNAKQIGYLEKSKYSIERMRRNISDLLKSKIFRKGFNQSAKAISLAIQIHIPETEVAESLLSRGYLPPIISLFEPLSKALKQWEKHSPELIHFDKQINDLLKNRDSSKEKY